MASKRHVKQKKCLRKVRYEDIQEARRMVWKMIKTLGSVGVQAYGCRYCGGYHVGHVPRRFVGR